METGEHTTSETAQEMDEASEIANLKKVEAALFLSARFLTLQDLVMLTDINPLMIRELIEKLVEKYNSDKSAIEVIVKEDMWKMDVGQEYVGMVNKLATGSAEFSKAEQETLAVIAYKQPVKQSVIIKIRGNKAYDHIKHFIDIGLVQAKKAGRTKELRLSDDFYEYFHLQKKGDGSTELVVESTKEVVADIDNDKAEEIEEAVKEVEAEESEEEGKTEEKEVEPGEVVEEEEESEEKTEEASAEEKHEAIDEEKQEVTGE
tara:strand:- start:371 stop:1153 length:783 start_codon:yes stop_codon:yes gene_type:complete